MLSPMMACEEAYLLGKAIRALDPQALLISGPVPTAAADEVFKNPATGKTTFTIKAEKVPNAAGIRRVIELLGGPHLKFDELADKANDPAIAKLAGGWIVGGYLSEWAPAALPTSISKGFRVVQDILSNKLTDGASIVIPGAAWAEKDGCWINHAGHIQAFAAAIAPPEGAARDGDVYNAILGRAGQYNAAAVRKEMGDTFAVCVAPVVAHESPALELIEL
jgi:NADH-quinone oxidoreductase subunit G